MCPTFRNTRDTVIALTPAARAMVRNDGWPEWSSGGLIMAGNEKKRASGGLTSSADNDDFSRARGQIVNVFSRQRERRGFGLSRNELSRHRRRGEKRIGIFSGGGNQ